MSEEVTNLRLETLEDFRDSQLAVNKDLLDGIAELKNLLIAANARACSKPGHCLMLDADLQNHKLSFYEKFTSYDKTLAEITQWRKEVDGDFRKLNEKFNQWLGVLSMIGIIIGPCVMWGLTYLFPHK